MLTWLSPRFQAQRPALLGCLTAQKDQATSQDHLFHTVLGLLSVKTTVKDDTLDLTAECV
jgi:lipid A ethanolaminephosphotransferase